MIPMIANTAPVITGAALIRSHMTHFPSCNCVEKGKRRIPRIAPLPREKYRETIWRDDMARRCGGHAVKKRTLLFFTLSYKLTIVSLGPIADRKSGVSGTGGAVGVSPGGRR